MLPKNLLIGLALIVVLASGYFVRSGDKGTEPGQTQNDVVNTAAVVNFNPQPGEVLVSGVLDCTPLQSGGPISDDQCVMGLKGDDGKFYSLDTTKMEDALGEDLTGRVMVIGSFAAADASDEEAGEYKYDGVISVRAIQTN